MAKDNKTQSSDPKAPDYLVWHMLQKGDKSLWNKVGACWQHKDKKGMTLQLDVLPINGRIVLRQPVDSPSVEKGGA